MELNIASQDTYLHSGFKDGAVTFCVHLSSESHCDNEEINAAIEAWACSEENVSFSFQLSITSCIDDLIDFHSYTIDGKVVFDEKRKDAVMALRAELERSIARLDAIAYMAGPDGASTR